MIGFENSQIDRNDWDRTVFLVPEVNLPKLERAIAKLSKKAEKIEDYPILMIVAGYQFRDNPDGSKSKLYEVVLDIDPIKYDGWEFVARIDHSNETGNVLRTVPNTVVPERYRTAAPDCEHCNHKRLRRDTFVLLDTATDTYKQVGSTCLSDFLGHDVKHHARLAELSGYAFEACRAAQDSDGEQTLIDRRYVDMEEFLNHVAAMCRIDGWVSAKRASENESLTSTRYQALDNIYNESRGRFHESVTDADRQIAADALAVAQAYAEKDFLSEYEHNVLVIANATVIEHRSCGLAAAIVGVYYSRMQPRVAKTDLGDMKEVLSLFDRAGSKLKHPKINLNIPGTGDVVLSVAGERAKVPGSITVASPGAYGSNVWFGRIERDGRYSPSRQAPAGIETGLLAFAADPVGVLAEHGLRTGCCAMCNRRLTDARSTALGFGPVCAEKWSLDWKGAAKKMKVAA